MGKSPFDKFSGEGFIKTTSAPVSLSAEQRVQLNRKGNALFNAGDLESACRIFMTTGYSDGMIRLGDRYLADRRPIEALKMYWLAPDRNRADTLIEKIASIIRQMIEET